MSALRAKTALVTGGGRGLGAALCVALADAGVRVVVADMRPGLAEQIARGLARGGRDGHHHHCALDVTDEGQILECLASTRERYGGIDILINNAAIDYTLPLDELSVEQWDRVLATNLRGPFLLCKHLVPEMKRRGSAHIVNIASTAARRAWPNASAYHASKWGLLGFSQALHTELRPHGIKVTAVIAGGMRTPFLLERFPDLDPASLQDPANVAAAIVGVLSLPPESVVAELTVLPMRETSWP